MAVVATHWQATSAVFFDSRTPTEHRGLDSRDVLGLAPLINHFSEFRLAVGNDFPSRGILGTVVTPLALCVAAHKVHPSG